MITEAVANWFLGLVAGLVGLLPEPSAGAVEASESFTGRLDQVISQVANLGPIVPFEAIAVSAGVMFAFMGFALVFQVSRIVLSVATLGGGSV